MLGQESHARSGRIDPAAEPYPAHWYIEDEEKVAQARPHYLRATRIVALLLGWKARTGRDVQAGSELALRWDESNPGAGVDPDVYVVEPPPPEGDAVTSLKLWQTGHFPPLLCVEIVSPSRPGKDYTPDRYALSGVGELWVFDPDSRRAQDHGRAVPHPGVAARRRGELPARLRGRRPRLLDGDSTDGSSRSTRGERWASRTIRRGTRWWLTLEEMERASKEAERAAKEDALRAVDAERSAKEAERAAKNRLAEKLRALGIDPDAA